MADYSGAGKTILASLIVDQANTIPDTSTAYFYFKFRDQTRNTMLSAARSILAQLLRKDGNEDLLHQYFENKSFTGGMPLTQTKAKEMLRLALKSESNTKFIVLDGLDECERRERKDITTWFQEEVDKLPINEVGTIRVLFVSQDDGVGRHDLAQVPVIKVSSAENKADIQVFAEAWQKRIEERFGNLQVAGCQVANVVVAKSQGM